MDTKIQTVLDTWHEHFKNEDNQYSEFESSDIEYFVGCMLYNHFAFEKALETMKTMDLSYDFLSVCSNEYDENKVIIESIEFNEDKQKLKFLQDYIVQAKDKYTKPELYLLDRLDNHIKALAQRYALGVDAQPVDFQNPLYR